MCEGKHFLRTLTNMKRAKAELKQPPHILEEISFSTRTAIPVSVDIVVCIERNLNVLTILGSFGTYLPHKVTTYNSSIIMPSPKYQHPTGTTVPYEKV